MTREELTAEHITAHIVDGSAQTFRGRVTVAIKPQVALFTVQDGQKLRRIVIPLSRIAHISVCGELANDGAY